MNRLCTVWRSGVTFRSLNWITPVGVYLYILLLVSVMACSQRSWETNSQQHSCSYWSHKVLWFTFQVRGSVRRDSLPAHRPHIWTTTQNSAVEYAFHAACGIAFCPLSHCPALSCFLHPPTCLPFIMQIRHSRSSPGFPNTESSATFEEQRKGIHRKMFPLFYSSNEGNYQHVDMFFNTWSVQKTPALRANSNPQHSFYMRSWNSVFVGSTLQILYVK